MYKVTAERAGRQSMDDLMKSSLYLMRSELREIPLKDWNKTIATLDLNLSFKLHIEPLGKQELSEDLKKRLRLEIIALDDQYTFMQRIPRSHYVLVVGPIPYLFYLHQMRLLDLVLLVFIGMSLALPVFLWMRPHWQDLLKLENAAQRLGAGHLDERTHFDPTSSLSRLGVAFNQMADNVNTLIASKKQLIDGIAHELRTPLVRLRYRLEMSDNLSDSELQALNRDIGQLESLIDELLTYARLDRPQVALNIEPIDLPKWLEDKVDDIRLIHQERDIQLDIPHVGDFGGVDLRLMERVLDNWSTTRCAIPNSVCAWACGLTATSPACRSRMTGRAFRRKSANGCLNLSSVSTPAAIALPAAADWGWPLSIPSPSPTEDRCSSKAVRSAAPASVSAGR